MKEHKIIIDISTQPRPIVKIVPQKRIFSEKSLFAEDKGPKVSDISKGKGKVIRIGRSIHPMVAEENQPATSLDAITTIPQFPIKIAPIESDEPTPNPNSDRWHFIREATIVGIIAVIVVQSVFMMHAGIRFKDTLFQQTLAGIEELKSAKNDLATAHFSDTLSHFLAAKDLFASARQEITHINGGVSILPNSLLNMSNDLLHLGESVASIGGDITQGLNVLLTSANFKLALPAIKKAQATLREASSTLANISLSALPSDYQERFKQIQAELPTLNKSLDFFDTITPALLNITASSDTKRYLIMLQNTTERRGTGGFMGSFIEVTFQDGKLMSATPRDVYSVDWQQFKRRTTAPFLQPYMKGLALRDANYNPDFYQAAQDIAWAYEQSKQGSLDGVIAIDQSIVPYLLGITGPVYLPEFHVTLDQDNYYTILQYFIETDKDNPSTPKTILLDFIKAMGEKVGNIDSALKLGQYIPQFIQARHVQAAFFDPGLEAVAKQYALDGTLQKPEPSLDYLNINAINVGGNKGDRLLTRDYQRTVTVDKEGGISVTLTGTWKNHWNNEEENKIRGLFPQIDSLPRKIRDNFWYVIGKAATKHVVRFFVPKGSVLTDNKGLNYAPTSGEENGYTVWYGEVDVPMGGETAFTISYKLPFKLDVDSGDTYRFLFQKQAGAENETMTYTTNLASELEPLANYPSEVSQGANTQTITTDLNTDRYFEMLVKKR